MGPLHLALLFPALGLAKDPLSHLPDFGSCKSSSLLGSIWGNEAAACAPDGAAGGLVWEDSNQTVAKPLTPATWRFSKPCMENGKREFCIYSSPDFANGRGIMMLTTPRRAAEVERSRIFTRPEIYAEMAGRLNAETSDRWRIEAVPGKGMGLIATRDLQVGDHVMSTTPSVMIDYDVFYELEAAQIHQMQGEGVSYLPERHRNIFLNLSTHDGAEDYNSRVNKIILTNAFDIDNTGVVEKTEEGERESWYTVFPEISRMNHDCRPNADYYFDVETFTHNIHAVRPIMAGEEITVSYIDPVQPRHERLQRLNTSWHFPCSCSLCAQNAHQTAASDARIAQIEDLRAQFRDYEPGSQATPAMGELMVSLFQQERLWSSMYEAYTYAALEYNGAGEPWLASKYARLAIEHGLAAGGPKDSDVLAMQALVKDPWAHWSWMLRTKRRMNWVSNVEA
ncbi:Lysine methyltransferase [Apiospora rasikravindrae]|uniref:Lysine methyltransferase n=1 Tax=Apiospora rasikravindrae TaxID=990691 RepID=A0ABR1T7G9_9PEZI